ncbi:Cardiolipin synthase [Arenibacter antarcticus]|uniref:Phospholipase D family protein n=1 Tax=Arenibacter antarcticus TaxID=2040469 RepID=A0ABW5VDA4_9FLAO|nr:phospholipase D family protein [Arenibacter sp. H213]MCM4168408.1 hypothetical protein [Arenibacter sp. H213]
MYFNQAICDVYIGTGAGKKLMEDIGNAKRSVKIVSPFLSPFLVRKLIDLHYKEIEVQLITVDTIEDFYGDRQKNIHQLIFQDRTIDKEAEAQRLKWRKRKQLLFLILTFLILALIATAILIQERMVLWGFIPLLPVCFLIRYYTSRIRNAKIYHYSYSQLFPFKVFTTPESNSYSHPFIHGKIYLIDDEIAYLGSLNFTNNGTRNNYETRIRMVDRKAVKELVAEFETLFHNEIYLEKELSEWGRELYVEPGN